jgi:sugar lactone lactonase YvrE
MLDAMRSLAASKGRPMRILQKSLSLLLPLLLLALGSGCHHGSNANAVGTPPSITLQPLDTNTVSGRLTTFTITANGAPVLRYQWVKDGVNIFGALGASFTLFNPQPTDSGRYSVTVTNDYGSVPSYAALLTVVPTPEFTAAVSVVSDAAGNLFVSDRDAHVIWQVSPSKQVLLLAGSQGIAGSVDGQGSSAQFRNPGGLAFDLAGNLVVADTGNHTIRRVAMDGTVTTLAGSPGLPGTANGVGGLARFNGPYGLAVDGQGGIYISDSQNHTIRFMAVDGTVSTYAGTPGISGQGNGSASSAQFDQPNGLAVGPDGTLYISDYGNSCIRMISPNAQVSTLAGLAGTAGYIDATGTASLFNLPVGLTLDAGGNVWVADTRNQVIRRITPGGAIDTIAGSASGSAGNADGLGAAALFNFPCGITSISSGTLAGKIVVADTSNHILRIVAPDGTVTTL